MIVELIIDQYKSTMMTGKMVDVTETAVPTVDIWSYVQQLIDEKIVLEYVFDKQLVEIVYRNQANSFDHILLPTENKNIFISIIVDLLQKK
jgi:hypothetical protein